MSGVLEIRKLLVANRGEIARRVIRTAREMGITTVAVYSDPDSSAPFVIEADEAVPIGGSQSSESYLRTDAILTAARLTDAGAVHPGYGFLAESAAFARACREHGLIFVGPDPDVIERMGSKIEAKAAARAAGLPVLPTIVISGDEAPDVTEIGYPLLLKASAGGGGRGMRIVRTADELSAAIGAARREAESAFGDPLVFAEPYIDSPRHVEVQIFGDAFGNVIHLYERECSIQRRYQKVIEESPSPGICPETRAELFAAATALARSIGYVGAGTVEFIVAPDGRFHFLEVNTRLQVEHPVTEAVTGLDLVRLQLEVAVGLPLPEGPPPTRGHAVEARLYAEDPAQGWAPMTGVLHRFRPTTATGVRVDSAVWDGSVVSPYYDSMLAKFIAHAPTRDEACRRLDAALVSTDIHGLRTNRDLLVRVLRDAEFRGGHFDTHFLESERLRNLAAPLTAVEEVRVHCVAAALVGRHLRRSERSLNPHVPPGWRNVRALPQKVEFATACGNVEVSYWSTPRFEVRIDGQPMDLEVPEISDSHCDLVVAGVRRRFRLESAGSRWFVDSHAGSSQLEQLSRFPAASFHGETDSLLSPVPGLVVALLVEPGQVVEEGQDLVVLEAMKMEHRVRAPHGGTVVELRVTVGQVVEAGAILAVVE